MVRLKLKVRFISEDVFLQSLDSTTPQKFMFLEKSFVYMVKVPEETSVGLLTNELIEKYERMYKNPLGEIRYLKDGELDADLDPEMSLYDALVDGGMAEMESRDQNATIKVVHEKQGQKFGMREGSVVPDLNKAMFRPRQMPPPPPLFGDAPKSSKRSRDEAFTGEEPAQRRPFKTHRPQSPEMGLNLAIPSIEGSSHASSSRLSHDTVMPEISDIVPETQETSAQLSDYQRNGSEILGELDRLRGHGNRETADRIVSANSSHLMDVDEEVELQLQDAPSREKRGRRARRSGARAHAQPTSRLSPDYYAAADSPAENEHQPNEQQMIKEHPITPLGTLPSDRRAAPKSGQTDRNAGTGTVQRFSKVLLPRSHQPQAETDIDDSQMSPRSRQSDRRLKVNRLPASASIGMRKLSGQSSSTGIADSIQGSKRPRRDTYDFVALTEDEADTRPVRRKGKKTTEQSGVIDLLADTQQKAKTLPRIKAKAKSMNTPSRTAVVDESSGSTEVPAVQIVNGTRVRDGHVDDPDKEKDRSQRAASFSFQLAAPIFMDDQISRATQDSHMAGGRAVQDSISPEVQETVTSETRPGSKGTLKSGEQILKPRLSSNRSGLENFIDETNGWSFAKKLGRPRKQKDSLGEASAQLSQELRASVESTRESALRSISAETETETSKSSTDGRPSALESARAAIKSAELTNGQLKVPVGTVGKTSGGQSKKQVEEVEEFEEEIESETEETSESASTEEQTFGEQLKQASSQTKASVQVRSSSVESESISESESAEATPKAVPQNKNVVSIYTTESAVPRPRQTATKNLYDKPETASSTTSSSASKVSANFNEQLEEDDESVSETATQTTSSGTKSSTETIDKSGVGGHKPSGSDKALRQIVPKSVPVESSTAVPKVTAKVLPPGMTMEEYDSIYSNPEKYPTPPPRNYRAKKANQSRTPSTDRGSGTPVPVASRGVNKPSKLRQETQTTPKSASKQPKVKKIATPAQEATLQVTQVIATQPGTAKKANPDLNVSGSAARGSMAELSARREKERGKLLSSSQNSLQHTPALGRVFHGPNKGNPVVSSSSSESESETETESESEVAVPKAKAKAPVKAPAKPTITINRSPASKIVKPVVNANTNLKTIASAALGSGAKASTPKPSSFGTAAPASGGSGTPRGVMAANVAIARTPAHSSQGVDLSIRDPEPETSEDESD